jgi:ABC-type transport system involved in multi-copper enzyme maturation permease subunit
MSSRTIIDGPTGETALPDDKAQGEFAPSVVKGDEPRIARWFGSIGLMLVALAGFALVFQLTGSVSRIGPGSRIFLIAFGTAFMLFHASRDPDVQIRRAYGLLGAVLLVLAAILSAIPLPGGGGTLFLPWGFLCLPLSMLFLMAFVRNETEPLWHRAGVAVLGATGIALALTGFIGGNVSPNFLLPYGLLLAVAGLGYWWAFVGSLGASNDLGYRAGLAMGAVGVLAFLVALGRSVLPPLFHSMGWLAQRPEGSYLASSGVLLMTLGLAYTAVSAGYCSDNRLIALARRELAAFFYSPIAYIVLFAMAFAALWMFFQFVTIAMAAADMGQPYFEPIIANYIFSFVPVVCMIIIVPVLTMRLMSEERRTGTLEVLLTAPVNETTIVLSKFLAAWIFFMILWVPWGLFLVALRVEGGTPFDYRPLYSFSIALAASGASFLSMGLFFSSLTKNQIIAAVLTSVVMVVFVVFYFLATIQLGGAGGAWKTLFAHISFIDLWGTSLQGRLGLRDLLFPVTSTIFWLFLTVQVLDARKWS